jgi:TetR/AcrR family transcriptional repressor of lmrAB and yxaGH operons
MSAPRRSREEIVPILRDVFRQRGYDGASLSAISEATGLGRASLYHHFPGGKDEMVEAALADVETLIEERIIAPLGRRDRSPAERLALMSRELDSFHEGGRAACLCGVLALTAPNWHGRVDQIFARWQKALAALAVDAGAGRPAAREAAEEALARIEGALILAAAQSSTSPFRRALNALPAILLGEGTVRLRKQAKVST